MKRKDSRLWGKVIFLMAFPHGLILPRRMPTNWVLKQLAFPPPVNAFKPGETLDGRQTPPRISYRNQERIRRACAMADIDPESIGLPSRMARAREMSDQERQSSQVLHKMQISKSTKKIIAQAER